MRPACGTCLSMAYKCSRMGNTRAQHLDRSSVGRDGSTTNEIRKPKPEGRKKSEFRSPNDGTAHAYSAFGFLSDFGIREAIAKLTTFGYSHAPFPLTPALSLREREHHRQHLRQPEPLGVVATRSLVLPLPEGEGRGEGERGLEIADHRSFATGSWVSNFDF